MGGESIKPIRKRIHVYFLMTAYENGSGDLFHPVPQFIYDNLLRRSDKAAFVSKYLAYDLSFNRISIQ